MASRTVAVLLSSLLAACGTRKHTHNDASVQAVVRDCPTVTLEPDVLQLVENGPIDLSSRVLVFADFIRTSDISATAVVMDPTTNLTTKQPATVGTVIAVGSDRYCVTEMRATATTARVTLRKVVSPL